MLQSVPRSIFIAVIALLLLPVSRVNAATAVAPVPTEIIDGLKSLNTADAGQRQKFYDLLTQKGDARLIPALTAYRMGTLLLRDSKLAIYGDRVDVAGQGSMLPLLDAITGTPITGSDGKPVENQG